MLLVSLPSLRVFLSLCCSLKTGVESEPARPDAPEIVASFGEMRDCRWVSAGENARPGDAVTRGQTLGLTGASGLAGGDHLHFTTLVGGYAVNPIEWWDGHWIKDRIALKLGDILPFVDVK